MNRRNFLRGMMTASAAAVAAHFGAPEYMGEEIKEELAKDLLKDPVTVGFSDVAVFDDRPVWMSLGKVRDYWADECAKHLGRPVDEGIRSAAYQIAAKMESRLRDARVLEDQKIVLEVPRFTPARRLWINGTSQMHCDLMCGVSEVNDPFGQKQVKVGYIPELVDVNGRKLA